MSSVEKQQKEARQWTRKHPDRGVQSFARRGDRLFRSVGNPVEKAADVRKFPNGFWGSKGIARLATKPERYPKGHPRAGEVAVGENQIIDYPAFFSTKEAAEAVLAEIRADYQARIGKMMESGANAYVGGKSAADYAAPTTTTEPERTERATKTAGERRKMREKLREMGGKVGEFGAMLVEGRRTITTAEARRMVEAAQAAADEADEPEDVAAALATEFDAVTIVPDYDPTILAGYIDQITDIPSAIATLQALKYLVSFDETQQSAPCACKGK